MEHRRHLDKVRQTGGLREVPLDAGKRPDHRVVCVPVEMVVVVSVVMVV